MKRGPETDLAARYADRLKKATRPLGLGWEGVFELSEAREATASLRQEAEATAILDRVPPGAAIVALDERGTALTSEAFATMVATRRDGGIPHLAFTIGGPDGHGEALRERADLLLALGPMTWPHQLARVLLLEQLYRAATILAGHPYHRA